MNGRSCQRQALGVAACISAALAAGAVFGIGPAARAQETERADTAQAAGGVPVRLARLETQALHARPWRRLTDARVQEARARIQIARAAYAPTLNLQSDVSLTPGQRIVDLQGYKVNAAFPLGQSGAFKPATRYGVMLDLRGNLYDFGRTSAAVAAAEAQARAEHAERRGSERQTVLDVRAGYLRWLTAHALWSIAQRAEQAAAERLARTRAALDEGARPPADVTAAESGEGFAQLELERARADLESAREDLSVVASVELDEAAFPADDLLHVVANGAEQASSPKAPPDTRVHALREQRSAAQASARVHDHAFQPVLSANAQAGVQGLNNNLFPVYRVGVSVVVPLWDGGAERANRAQSQARAAQLGAQAEQLERGLERAEQRRRMLLRQAERRIGVAEKLVEVCSARLSQLEDGWTLGAASYADLSDARSALSRAQTELVLAQTMRAQARLGLD